MGGFSVQIPKPLVGLRTIPPGIWFGSGFPVNHALPTPGFARALADQGPKGSVSPERSIPHTSAPSAPSARSAASRQLQPPALQEPRAQHAAH